MGVDKDDTKVDEEAQVQDSALRDGLRDYLRSHVVVSGWGLRVTYVKVKMTFNRSVPSHNGNFGSLTEIDDSS